MSFTVSNLLRLVFALLVAIATEIGIRILRVYRAGLGVVYYLYGLYRIRFPLELHNRIRRVYIWDPNAIEELDISIPLEDLESISLATIWAIANGNFHETEKGTLVGLSAIIVEADVTWVMTQAPDTREYYIRFNTPYMQPTPIRPDTAVADIPESTTQAAQQIDVTAYLGHRNCWNLYGSGMPSWRYIPEVCRAVHARGCTKSSQTIWIQVLLDDFSDDPEIITLRP